MFIALHLQNR